MNNRLLFCLMAVVGLLALLSAQVVCAAEHNGRPTIAIALGGGGARGVAHIGVLRVFEREGIPVDFVAGSSTGAFIGALYCAGVPLSKIEEVVLNDSAKNAFAPRPMILRAVMRSGWLVLSAKYRPYYPGIYNGKKFARFVNKLVPEDRRRIENLKIPFTCVVTNLVDGKPYNLTSGDLGNTVLSACTIPGVHRPVLTEKGQLFVDAGITANMPTYSARETGADIVIAVDVNDDVNPIDPKSMKSLRNMANRVTSIVVCAQDVGPRKAADIVVRPEVGGIALLSRKHDHLIQAIAAGEKAAMDMLPAIKAKMNGASLVQKSHKVHLAGSE